MNPFLIRFVALSIVSGCTIGINKILMTMLGLSLHCNNWQLGLISAAETLGLAMGTIPAGLMVSRGSPRALYGIVSIILAAFYVLIPHIVPWFLLLPVMWFTGSLISFRIVAMSSSFLDQMRQLGAGWAGWYKGTLSLGILALGPWIGHQLIEMGGLRVTFVVSSLLFAGMALGGLFALPARTEGKARGVARSGNWLLPIWQDRPVRRACAMEGLSGFCSAFFGTFMLVILVRDYGWAPGQAIQVLLVNGSVYVSVLLGAGWILQRTHRSTLDRVVYGGTAAALVGLGLVRSAIGFFACTALFSLGLGFNNLINVTSISASRCDRGHVSGVSTLMQMAGGCLGSFLGGLLGRAIPLQLSFPLFAVPWLVALAAVPTEPRTSGLEPRFIQ